MIWWIWCHQNLVDLVDWWIGGSTCRGDREGVAQIQTVPPTGETFIYYFPFFPSLCPCPLNCWANYNEVFPDRSWWRTLVTLQWVRWRSTMLEKMWSTSQNLSWTLAFPSSSRWCLACIDVIVRCIFHDKKHLFQFCFSSDSEWEANSSLQLHESPGSWDLAVSVCLRII